MSNEDAKELGEGTVYQESGNKWTAKISLGIPPDGKALFKRFSARTKGEVEKKLKAFRRSLNETETACACIGTTLVIIVSNSTKVSNRFLFATC